MKALEGFNMRLGPAGVWRLTSQGAQLGGPAWANCPPGLLAKTASRDKGRFLKQ